VTHAGKQHSNRFSENLQALTTAFVQLLVILNFIISLKASNPKEASFSKQLEKKEMKNIPQK
jgi:hypothetical protein